MRELTQAELALISGGFGDDDEDIVVTGSPYPPTYPPPYEPPVFYPPPGGYFPNPPSAPPYGGGPAPAQQHTTPGGAHYTTSITLTAAQSAVADKIVDYGVQNGKTADEIRIAVNQAYYESSLGTLTSNPGNSDVQGLYQYSSAEWSMYHSDLNRSSNDDQIKALYQDIDRYEGRYQTGQANSSIPSSLSFEDYVEVKHHAGSNSTAWTSPYIADYESKAATLGYKP